MLRPGIALDVVTEHFMLFRHWPGARHRFVPRALVWLFLLVPTALSALPDTPSPETLPRLVQEANISQIGPDTFLVTLTYAVRNRGSISLQNLQVHADLGLDFPGASVLADHVPESADFTVNPSFDGRDDTRLLRGRDRLDPRAEGTIRITVTVTRESAQTEFRHKARLEAALPDGTPLPAPAGTGHDATRPGFETLDPPVHIGLVGPSVPTLGTAGLVALICGLASLVLNISRARAQE
ncbi:hypothetical protein SCOR_29160 [Sulfidibacter corallicola]